MIITFKLLIVKLFIHIKQFKNLIFELQTFCFLQYSTNAIQMDIQSLKEWQKPFDFIH